MTVYNSYELLEAAFTGTSPAEIRAYNQGNAYTASNAPTSSTGNSRFANNTTATPTHITHSYFVNELSMTVKGGTRISLIEVMKSMEIYEDIFSKSIHGFVEISDIDGGISKFMLTGGEVINMTILKPMPSSEIIISRNDLVVHQISKVDIDDLNSMTYKLHFMPKSAIAAQKKRIYKAFGSNSTSNPTAPSISDTISNIYNDIANGLTLYKNVDDLPRLQKKFLSPGYTPYEAIDALVKRSCYDGDYFLFFERLNKLNGGNHVFTSINKLKDYWEKETSLPTILYQPILSHITPEDATALLATNIQIQDNFDHINNMNSGFYNSRLRMLDTVERKFYDVNLNYSAIQDAASASKFITNDNTFLDYDSLYPEYPGERLMARPVNDVIANKNTWVKNEVYGSIMLSNMRVNIDISGGNNLIGAGNIVNLKIPSFYAKSLNLEGSIVPDDIVYAGKYIVTAVRHIFDISSYVKKVELSKESGRINLGYAINQLSNIPPPSVSYSDRSRTAPVPGAPPPPPPRPKWPQWITTGYSDTGEPIGYWSYGPEIGPLESTTCFPAGSMVLMADGSEKRIETITIDDILMGADGIPAKIKVIDVPVLGPTRRMLAFSEDDTMHWSNEHLFWGKNDSRQWWWTASHEEWIKEVEAGEIVGLKDNNSFLPTEGFKFANMEGFVGRTIVDVTDRYKDGARTQLYLPVTESAVPIIVNGYVVTAGTNEFIYDYTKFDWNITRTSVISKIQR